MQEEDASPESARTDDELDVLLHVSALVNRQAPTPPPSAPSVVPAAPAAPASRLPTLCTVRVQLTAVLLITIIALTALLSWDQQLERSSLNTPSDIDAGAGGAGGTADHPSNSGTPAPTRPPTPPPGTPPCTPTPSPTIDDPAVKIHVGGRTLTPSQWRKLEADLACFTDLSIAGSPGGTWVPTPDGSPHVLWGNATTDDPCVYEQHRGQCGPRATRASLRWVWTPPPSCPPTPPWTRESPCSWGGGDVLLIGDSLQFQWEMSLFNAVHTECTSKDWMVMDWGRRNDSINEGWPLVGCPPARMYLYREDSMTWPILRDPQPARINDVPKPTVRPLYTRLRSDTRIGTIVLNRGAHPVSTPDLLQVLSDILTELRTVRPEVTVVWRNTPPGHAKCWEPKTRDGPPLGAFPPTEGLPFFWGTFAAQNEAVREYLSTHWPGVVYLDVASASTVRADSHQVGNLLGESRECVKLDEGGNPPICDCLHSCVPGPSDAWVEQLHRALWHVRHGKV